MFKKLLAIPLFRQMFKFGIVGFTSLIIDFSIYGWLTRSLPYFRAHILVANIISVACSLLWNFYANYRWTFRFSGVGSALEYASFIGVAMTGFAWNEFFLWFFTARAGLHDLIAKLAAVVVVFFWNFSMQRAITFGLAHRRSAKQKNGVY